MFSFISNEYPIKIGDRYNYIDLLLYNIKYKCYVVVELKITELKKEHPYYEGIQTDDWTQIPTLVMQIIKEKTKKKSL